MADKNLGTVRVGVTRSSTSSIFERATNAATQMAIQRATSRIPAGARKHLPLARKLLTGGVSGLIDAGLNQAFERLGLNGTLLPGQADLSQPSELLGGITLAQARQVLEEHSAQVFAKKNLWLLRVRNLKGGASLDINMFATDVAYSRFSAQGDAVLIGSGSFDNVTNADRVEMRVTTMDNTYGEVKRWFEERFRKMCRADGTYGLPIDYLFRVDVTHAHVSESVEGAENAVIDTFIMRPGTLETDFSRREDALQELQMTFVQWDTFSALA